MALLTTTDLFMLKALSPPATSNQAAALYSAAVTLARLPYFLTSALVTAVFPYVARAREDREQTTLYVRKGLLFVVSLLTRAHEEKELVGLVYSLTERPPQHGLRWYQRPAVLAVVVLAATALLNIVFR